MGDRLLYATPTGKHPHPGYVQSARCMEMTCTSFERRLEDFQMAAGPVQMARTTIAEAALKGNCYQKHDHAKDHKHCRHEPYDFLVMHDDDLLVDSIGPAGNPLDVWHELFQKAPDVGVIGAVYLREKLETPCIVMAHPEYPEENCHLVYGMPASPFSVAGVGTGFIMIRISALRALVDKEDGAHAIFRFPFNRTRWGVVNHTGEDYDFCTRMRGAGFKVIADPRFETVHIKESGLLEFSWSRYERQWIDQVPDGVVPEVWEQSVLANATRVRKACSAGITTIDINGFMCLDHVPQLKAEANQMSEARAAKAAKKEAA